MRVMRAATIIGLALVAVTFVGPHPARAANNGELIQATGDRRVYYVEGIVKRWVPDTATFNAWGFNNRPVRRVSRAELNSHQTGPNLTRLINFREDVYYVADGQRRYVSSFDLLAYYGVSSSSLTVVYDDLFNCLSSGSNLTAPFAFRLSGDRRVYLVDGGTRRPFASDDVLAHWGLNRSSVPINNSLRQLPVGADITRLINVDENVYWIENGARRYVPSNAALLYNELSWSDLRRISSSVANNLGEGAILKPPVLIATSGNHKVWLIDDNGVRRHVPDLETLYDLGLNLSQIKWLSNSIVYTFPEGDDVSRYWRDLSGIYFYVLDGMRHEFNGRDAVQARLLGMTSSNVRDVGWTLIYLLAKGNYIQSGADSLEGYGIPATSGRTATEQHLYLGRDEESAGRNDPAIHYSRSGTPDYAKNGMAGGYGAFGSSSSPASTEQERYYITMRWNYCEWYDDAGTTRTRSCSSSAKSWHRHKKVVVTNPNNGRQLIASVEEAGPAIWTGRVSGLSPEAMAELDAVTDTTLNYLWAVDQNIGLGRIN